MNPRAGLENFEKGKVFCFYRDSNRGPSSQYPSRYTNYAIQVYTKIQEKLGAPIFTTSTLKMEVVFVFFFETSRVSDYLALHYRRISA